MHDRYFYKQTNNQYNMLVNKQIVTNWTYEQSKEYMKQHHAEVKTKAQFVKMVQGKAIGYLPLRPNKTYKGNGWISWEDFLNKQSNLEHF